MEKRVLVPEVVLSSTTASDDVASPATGSTTAPDLTFDAGFWALLRSSPVKKVNVKACSPTNDFRGPNPPYWVQQLYLEPLKEGWRREVVYRSRSARKTLDIYYYAPDGTKLRSRPEVAEYLAERRITKYSALFNFSFHNRQFGGEFAPYETVRSSKIQLGRSDKSNGPPDTPLKSSPAPVKRPRSSKIKMRNYVKHPTSSDPLFCICSSVEKGNMIQCDNGVCEIGWYHFDCIKMVEAPSGTWYCPICRGSDSSMMNPAFATKKVISSKTP